MPIDTYLEHIDPDRRANMVNSHFQKLGPALMTRVKRLKTIIMYHVDARPLPMTPYSFRVQSPILHRIIWWGLGLPIQLYIAYITQIIERTIFRPLTILFFPGLQLVLPFWILCQFFERKTEPDYWSSYAWAKRFFQKENLSELHDNANIYSQLVLHIRDRRPILRPFSSFIADMSQEPNG